MSSKGESSAETPGEGKGVSGDEYYAFDLYPERRNKVGPSWFSKLFDRPGDSSVQKQKCEMNVLNALKTHPMVRTLLNALESSGCPIKIGRHICCEVCDTKVTGGYDSEWNQIVICQNLYKARQMPEVTLIHELIHMFDYCVNDVNFKNIDHLACSEIRAANLAHCSFLSSFFLSQSSLFDIKDTHQYCVRMKAAQSLMVARNMDFDTAIGYVNRVFDKCYNDLEPIGRRVRRNSQDPFMAYDEAAHYGYRKTKYEKGTSD